MTVRCIGPADASRCVPNRTGYAVLQITLRTVAVPPSMSVDNRAVNVSDAPRFPYAYIVIRPPFTG